MSTVVFFVLFVVCTGLCPTIAQSSINSHEGLNVGLHAGIALAMCFFILTTCAIGVNVISYWSTSLKPNSSQASVS